ncbi:MAG: hypothetical protein ABIJ09_08565 [Pseudomonadota bacterium]
MSTDTPLRVAVFDADAPPALAVTRSLGRAGVEVEVFTPHRGSVAGLSRHARRERLCPPLGDASRFVPWLDDALRSGDIELIVPTTDLMTYYISTVREHLPASALHALPEHDAILDALFKDRFHRACLAVGQLVPWQKAPVSTDDALDGAGDYPYPLIVKPRSHVVVPLARGTVVAGPTELRAAFAPFPVAPGQRDLVERHPEQRWPVLQAYVPGALAHLFSISGVLGGDDAALATSLCQKTSQWPPTLGVGTVFHSLDDPDLLAQGTRLARRMLGRGLFELELILDSGGRALAVDLNPRAFGQISLNLRRGHDLPLLWYRQSCGLAIEAATAPRAGVSWRHALPYHIDQGLQLWHAPDRLAQLTRYLHEVGTPHVDIVNDLRDPVPSLVFTVKMLRHPRALVRSLRRSTT